MRIRIVDTVKRLLNTGYCFTEKDNRQHIRYNLVSFYDINQVIKSLLDQASGISGFPFIAPKRCRVTSISDIEFHIVTPDYSEQAQEETGNTAYITFRTQAISTFDTNIDKILQDFASCIFNAVKKNISRREYIELSVSVNYEKSPAHMPFTIIAGIMIEGVADA